jgi:hypothetical protein
MWGIQSTQPLVYTGGIEFTSLLSDPDVALGRRSEYSDSWLQPLGTTWSYSWQLRLPVDWEQDSEWCVISQAHPSGVPGGTSPSFALEIYQGNLRVRVRNDADSSGVEYDQPAIFGDWLKFELSVRWSTTTTGNLTLKMNGAEIVSVLAQANYYEAATDGPNFKCGLYIADLSAVAKRTIEVRV